MHGPAPQRSRTLQLVVLELPHALQEARLRRQRLLVPGRRRALGGRVALNAQGLRGRGGSRGAVPGSRVVGGGWGDGQSAPAGSRRPEQHLRLPASQLLQAASSPAAAQTAAAPGPLPRGPPAAPTWPWRAKGSRQARRAGEAQRSLRLSMPPAAAAALPTHARKRPPAAQPARSPVVVQAPPLDQALLPARRGRRGAGPRGDHALDLRGGRFRARAASAVSAVQWALGWGRWTCIIGSLAGWECSAATRQAPPSAQAPPAPALACSHCACTFGSTLGASRVSRTNRCSCCGAMRAAARSLTHRHDLRCVRGGCRGGDRSWRVGGAADSRAEAPPATQGCLQMSECTAGRKAKQACLWLRPLNFTKYSRAPSLPTAARRHPRKPSTSCRPATHRLHARLPASSPSCGRGGAGRGARGARGR